jgi:predicted PurR-regulated permease PerM
MIPLISNIIRDASALGSTSTVGPNPIEKVNQWLIGVFPNLDPDFDIAALLIQKVQELVDFGKVGGIVGSVASLVVDLFVALFSVTFISFFFIKEEGLFDRIICALVPDKHELTLNKTLNEIKELLSRYFVGLLIEMIGVALIDFLGLWLIARLDFSYAIGIAFIAGLLNVIPYVGPIIGEVIGVVFGIVLKLGTGAGLAVNIWLFALIILAIMLSAQLIDNLISQPLIYSTSIKAHPLEIFIVLLMAGHIGGTVGMLVAIPAYTVVRVVAIRFFYRYKIIQRLVPNLSDEDKIIENID